MNDSPCMRPQVLLGLFSLEAMPAGRQAAGHSNGVKNLLLIYRKISVVVLVIVLMFLFGCTGSTAIVRPGILEIPEYRKSSMSASFSVGADGIDSYEGIPDENSMIGVSIDLKKIQDAAGHKLMGSMFSKAGNNDHSPDIKITSTINNFAYSIKSEGLSNYPVISFDLDLQAHDRNGDLIYSRRIKTRGYESEKGYFAVSLVSDLFTQLDANKLSQLVGDTTLKKVAGIYFMGFEEIIYEFKDKAVR